MDTEIPLSQQRISMGKTSSLFNNYDGHPWIRLSFIVLIYCEDKYTYIFICNILPQYDMVKAFVAGIQFQEKHEHANVIYTPEARPSQPLCWKGITCPYIWHGKLWNSPTQLLSACNLFTNDYIVTPWGLGTYIWVSALGPGSSLVIIINWTYTVCGIFSIEPLGMNVREIWAKKLFDAVVCKIWFIFMKTSSNGNIFRVTGHLCGEFTGPRWIPHTKASDAELWCFFWSASK